MANLLRTNPDEALGESWVELSSNGGGTPHPTTPDRATPPSGYLLGEEHLRLLREAQRESSGASSARVSSPASSRRDTPWDSASPKSPPNSPNTELSNEEDLLKGVYVNYCGVGGGREAGEMLERNTDWIWDWSSRPDQQPPKGWNFQHPTRVSYSIRTTKVGRSGLFSKEVLYTLFITNVISLLIGTGIGVWLSRRGFFLPRLSLP